MTRLSDVRPDLAWMDRGRCASLPPNTMFPETAAGVEIAKRICARCPVQPQCLEYALAVREEHGVWGGTSKRDRNRILKQRKATAA